MVVYDEYQQLLVALSAALNERWESEAMGLFTALAEEEFLATLLLYRDIFDAIAPLNLALQKAMCHYVYPMLKHILTKHKIY